LLLSSPGFVIHFYRWKHKNKNKKQGERDVFGSEKWSSNRPSFLEKMWKISHKHVNIFLKKFGYLINKDMKIQ
jgi:hypothetical protein